MELEKAKIKEEVLLMLEEERMKAKIEQDALRAQMMCQAAESEERERMIHEEERMKAKIEQDALRAQMMCQVAQTEAEKVKAGEEADRILDDLRTQVTQLHFERSMTNVSVVSTTIYGDVDEIPESDSPETDDPTPCNGISSTERTCNIEMQEINFGIDCDADGDGDGDGNWVNRTLLQSVSEVSVIEDSKPFVPLYSESPPRHSTRHKFFTESSPDLTPRFGSLIEASSNYSDLGTSEDRRTYDR